MRSPARDLRSRVDAGIVAFVVAVIREANRGAAGMRCLSHRYAVLGVDRAKTFRHGSSSNQMLAGRWLMQVVAAHQRRASSRERCASVEADCHVAGAALSCSVVSMKAQKRCPVWRNALRGGRAWSMTMDPEGEI